MKFGAGPETPGRGQTDIRPGHGRAEESAPAFCISSYLSLYKKKKKSLNLVITSKYSHLEVKNKQTKSMFFDSLFQLGSPQTVTEWNRISRTVKFPQHATLVLIVTCGSGPSLPLKYANS